MREVEAPLQRQALVRKWMFTTHVFGVLGVAFSAFLLIMGMVAGGLTVLAMTVLFWGGTAASVRAGRKKGQ